MSTKMAYTNSNGYAVGVFSFLISRRFPSIAQNVIFHLNAKIVDVQHNFDDSVIHTLSRMFDTNEATPESKLLLAWYCLLCAYICHYCSEQRSLIRIYPLVESREQPSWDLYAFVESTRSLPMPFVNINRMLPCTKLTKYQSNPSLN